MMWWSSTTNDNFVTEGPEFWTNGTKKTTTPESGLQLAFFYTADSSKYKWTWSSPDSLLSSICEVSLTEAYRILSDARDHMYGTNITDPRDVLTGPKFIQQPMSILVVDVDYVTLQCEAQSNPTPTYVWLKGGVRLDAADDSRYTINSGKLTITEPRDDKDEGQYQCQATNQFGTIISDTGSISFGFLAEFSNDPPGAVTGRLYQGIAINCGLPAYKSALDIKWFKEDGGPNFLRTDLQPHQFNSKNGKLYFSELTTSDAGVYHCVLALVALVGQVIFSGQGPSRTSLGMELIVIGETPSDYGPEIHNDFPAIFPTPALRGGTFTIECFAYGKMPLYYSWKRSNGTIPSKVTYSDHNRVLTIPDAQLEDAGDYTCMVNRGNSYTVEKSIQLIVEARPFFTFPLSDKHIDVNQEFVWFCEAQGLPAPVYSWYKDGLPIQHQPGNIEVHVNVLKIYKAQQTQHQGMYQCSASNTHGTTLTSAQLRILAFKPTFIRRPVNPSQMGTEGGNISIACQPEAAPSPNITWSKNGFPLAVSTEFKERIVQLTTGDLFIRDLQISDKGIYQCTASNDFGSESSSGLLTVVSQTVMTLVPSDVQSEVNSTVFLPCQASYDVREKELVYVWDFGGKNVLDLVDPSYKLEFQGSVPGLYILSVQVHHTGVYGCSAVTVDSFKRNTAYLQVVGPPGEPGGVKAEISGLNATIKWMPGETNFADVTKFHIEFNTNYNPSWRILINDIAFEAAISTVKNELCSYKVQGLKPGSSYKFRVVAYNRYGPGPASLPSTLYKVANAAPITAISGGITDEPWGPVGTLAVKWNALPEEDLTGDKIGYRIYYRKRVPFDSEQWNKGEVLGGVNQFFAVVGADNYYLQYDVKIAAFNEYGEGPNSSVQIVMSQADMPVGVATNITMKTHNSTAILVRWTPLPLIREFIRGKIIGYSINYWIKDGDMDSSNMYCGDTCDSVLLIGLQPKSYYWVNIQVVNTAGTGMVSENYFGRTWRRAPNSYPEYVHVQSHQGNSVHVMWRGVSTGSYEETIKGYKIRWWPINEDIRTANETIVAEKLTQKILHGIQSGTVYSLRVMAYSRGGDGRNSPTVYFTLEGQVMINPETTEIVNTASTYIPSVYVFLGVYLVHYRYQS
ncbi:contactin-like isoform X2 [Biomphalaria glabrata]|nr:contactin-like isoform X2 [Biomphalaria glabrata]